MKSEFILILSLSACLMVSACSAITGLGLNATTNISRAQENKLLYPPDYKQIPKRSVKTKVNQQKNAND